MSEYKPEPYQKEEKANALTHMPGILLAIFGTPYLFYIGQKNNASDLQLWGIVLFGISMFILYLASVLYHSAHEPEKKKQFRIFDHVAIYFLRGC
ncbi:MAG TPA: hypothetical protein ENJ95_02870 [Bacteroidetes bacterium]|nr:hypothetical protein [Bacteroidota bacterium]